MKLNENNPITADGTYEQDVIPGQQYLCHPAGDFGGGTLTFKYIDEITGDVRDVPLNTFTESTPFVFIVAASKIQFVLAGAVNPDLSIQIATLKVV